MAKSKQGNWNAIKIAKGTPCGKQMGCHCAADLVVNWSSDGVNYSLWVRVNWLCGDDA